MPNVYSALTGDVAEARRQAVNTIIQGTAADVLKLALVRLNERLPDDVHMLLTVHDSVLLEVPAELVEGTRQLVATAMEAVPDGFGVPEVEGRNAQDGAECSS